MFNKIRNNEQFATKFTNTFFNIFLKKYIVKAR